MCIDQSKVGIPDSNLKVTKKKRYPIRCSGSQRQSFFLSIEEKTTRTSGLLKNVNKYLSAT